MAMENPINLESCGVDLHCDQSINESVEINSSVQENEDQSADFLKEFDSYMEDIGDRVTISRMVSDSVIRGMVNAVEQEAADKIAQKELEIVRLKEAIDLYHVGFDDNESLEPLIKHYETKNAKGGLLYSFSEALLEHERIGGSLVSLKNAADQQFKNLRSEIKKVKGSNSIRRINSGSELVGLGGILQENVSQYWIDVDKTFDCLRTTLDSLYQKADDIIDISKDSLCQWHLEQEYRQDIEGMVIINCIRSLKETFEEKLCDQNAQLDGKETLNCRQKIKEISSLCQELDAISKSLFNPEVGQLTSYGSLENEDELSNHRRADHLQRKVSGSNVLSSIALWQTNGNHEESVITVPDNIEAAQLKHMNKEQMVSFFKTEMNKMKRNHDYKVQQMTEEYYSLKRDYLKLNERGSSLPVRKDKEFEVLRKKLPDVITKLDNILVENEKLPAFNDNIESLSSFKVRVESLLSENGQLSDLLTDKKREVNLLTAQVSDAVEKISQYSQTKADLMKKIENLECAVEDAHIEASVYEDAYNCILRDIMGQIECIREDSDMEGHIMKEVCDIIFRDAVCNAALIHSCEVEDSDLESFIGERVHASVYKEAFRDACKKLHDLGVNACDKEKALKLEVAENERLKQHMHLLAASIEEKKKLLQERDAALAKEKEKFVLSAQQCDSLRDKITQQQILISGCKKESNLFKFQLDQASELIELHKVEICELNQKFEQAMKELRESEDERRRLLAVSKEKQAALSLVEEKELVHKKQMESVVPLISGMSSAVSGLERKVAEDIKRKNMRLEYLSSQMSSLKKKASMLKGMGLQYREKYERKYSDLEKAEAEVDLLGDEVDALLSLLEKIYIALDHYSPVLQHYPGIIEILKLVRRELRGGSSKPI